MEYQATKHENEHDEVSEVDSNEGGIKNAFREMEKYFRAPPDPSKFTAPRNEKKKLLKAYEAEDREKFTRVIDFSDLERNTPENLKLINPVPIPSLPNQGFDYLPKIEKAYTLINHPGLVFIPNPFTPEQQRYWIARSVLGFTVNNPTNISVLHNSEYWKLWDSSQKYELKWATLGYHYQWTQRKYVRHIKGEFPEDLSSLCKYIAFHFGYANYEPEAATINFYARKRQCMCGHLDNAEEDLTKPIVSCSFGNTVVFLMGSRSTEDTPTPFFIRSGDIVIMGGESRYCYHGVPRMILNTIPSFLEEKNWKEEWIEGAKYIYDSRININARQVLIHDVVDIPSPKIHDVIYFSCFSSLHLPH